jgi:hypothetical protein
MCQLALVDFSSAHADSLLIMSAEKQLSRIGVIGDIHCEDDYQCRHTFSSTSTLLSLSRFLATFRAIL